MSEVTYLNLLNKVIHKGNKKSNRTGTDTYSLFGEQIRFDLNEGFPLLSSKKVHFKSVVHELLWFIMGDTNIRYLNDNGVTIWNEWADEFGDLGPIYGAQWRKWHVPFPDDDRTIDQLSTAINTIKTDPDSRRIIISAWNVSDLDKMALAPCHCLIQFNVRGNYLDCQLYQRSADIFLGVPFNIASYALLTMMVAQVTGLLPGEFIHTFGDVHIYENHLDQAYTQLNRAIRSFPTVKLNPAIKSIFDFRYGDITLENYNPHPAIKAEVAV